MDPSHWVPYAVNVRRLAATAPRSIAIQWRSPESLGTKHSRKFRYQGWTPAVLTNSPQKFFLVTQKEIVKQYQIPSWATRIVDLQTPEGETASRALLRLLKWHPLKDVPMSAEFLHYNPTPENAVKVDMPIELEGMQRCEAFGQGGFPHLIERTVPVYTYLDPIPASLVINVADFTMNQTIRVSDLWTGGAFPEGMWPAVQGSTKNLAIAKTTQWKDHVLFKIARS